MNLSYIMGFNKDFSNVSLNLEPLSIKTDKDYYSYSKAKGVVNDASIRSLSEPFEYFYAERQQNEWMTLSKNAFQTMEFKALNEGYNPLINASSSKSYYHHFVFRKWNDRLLYTNGYSLYEKLPDSRYNRLTKWVDLKKYHWEYHDKKVTRQAVVTFDVLNEKLAVLQKYTMLTNPQRTSASYEIRNIETDELVDSLIVDTLYNKVHYFNEVLYSLELINDALCLLKYPLTNEAELQLSKSKKKNEKHQNNFVTNQVIPEVSKNGIYIAYKEGDCVSCYNVIDLLKEKYSKDSVHFVFSSNQPIRPKEMKLIAENYKVNCFIDNALYDSILKNAKGYNGQVGIAEFKYNRIVYAAPMHDYDLSR